MTGLEQTSPDEPVSLAPFEELCGRFEGIIHTDRWCWVHLSAGSLRFAAGSPAARACERALAGAEGEWVGILRTPFHDEPIRVRRALADSEA